MASFALPNAACVIRGGVGRHSSTACSSLRRLLTKLQRGAYTASRPLSRVSQHGQRSTLLHALIATGVSTSSQLRDELAGFDPAGEEQDNQPVSEEAMWKRAQLDTCAALRLHGGPDDLQDLLAATILAETVYKKVEMDEKALAAKIAEYASLLPPGWLQLQSVQVSSDSISQHYIIAAAGKSMFVAFMGTKQPRDLITDANVVHEPVWAEAVALAADKQSVPAAHRGFLARARSIPVEQLYELAVSSNRRLVMCGHSLGGAVAKLCTLRLLRELPEVPSPDVRCLAFATPPVGNSALAELVDSAGWSKHFHTYYLPEDQLMHILSFASMRKEASVSSQTATANLPTPPSVPNIINLPHAPSSKSTDPQHRPLSPAAWPPTATTHATSDAASSSSAASAAAATAQAATAAAATPHSVASASSTSPAHPRSGTLHSAPKASMFAEDSLGSAKSMAPGDAVAVAAEDRVRAAIAATPSHAAGALATAVMSASASSTVDAGVAAAIEEAIAAGAVGIDGNAARPMGGKKQKKTPLLLSLAVAAGKAAERAAAAAAEKAGAAAGRAGAAAGKAAAAVRGGGGGRHVAVAPATADPQSGGGRGGGERDVDMTASDMGMLASVEDAVEEILSADDDALISHKSEAAAVNDSASAPGSSGGPGGQQGGGSGGGAKRVRPPLNAGLALALNRKRAMKHLRRLASNARVPPVQWPSAPVPKFHAFGHQWFVCSDGVYSPHELSARLALGPNIPQPPPVDLALYGVKGPFAHHRMMAYRLRHLEIIMRQLPAHLRSPKLDVPRVTTATTTTTASPSQDVKPRISITRAMPRIPLLPALAKTLLSPLQKVPQKFIRRRMPAGLSPVELSHETQRGRPSQHGLHSESDLADRA